MARALCLDCEGDFNDQDGLCPECGSARIDFTTYAEEEINMETSKCWDCKKTKPLEEFSTYVESYGGESKPCIFCKECIKKINDETEFDELEDIPYGEMTVDQKMVFLEEICEVPESGVEYPNGEYDTAAAIANMVLGK